MATLKQTEALERLLTYCRTQTRNDDSNSTRVGEAKRLCE